MEISLYFTRHTRQSTIDSFMNQAGVRKWYVTDDGPLMALARGDISEMSNSKGKGNPILFLDKDTSLVIHECQCLYYDTVSGEFWLGQPSLSQVAPYSIVTIGVILLICYILYKIL